MSVENAFINFIKNIKADYNKYKNYDKNKDGYFDNNELKAMLSKEDELVKNAITDKDIGLDNIRNFLGMEAGGKGAPVEHTTISAPKDIDNIPKNILDKIKKGNIYNNYSNAREDLAKASGELKQAQAKYNSARTKLEKSNSALPGLYDKYKAASDKAADKTKEREEAEKKQQVKNAELAEKLTALQDSKENNKQKEAYENWIKASNYCKQHPEGGPEYQANAALAQKYYSEWAGANNEIQNLQREIAALQGEVTYLSTQVQALSSQEAMLNTKAENAGTTYESAVDKNNQDENNFFNSTNELKEAQDAYNNAAVAQENAIQELDEAVAQAEAEVQAEASQQTATPSQTSETPQEESTDDNKQPAVQSTSKITNNAENNTIEIEKQGHVTEIITEN